MYIILAILAFGILIAGHELGHFLVAKACGVKVNEFALGMGPKILKKQGKETLYTLRAFPIGGFCAMEGEDEDSDDPRAFGSKKVWQKILILIAGAAMNFLIGFLLVLCIAPHANFAEPVISGFMDGCPYESADGLLAGDRIVSVDGHRTYFTGDFSEYIGRGGETHKIVLIRDGKLLPPFVAISGLGESAAWNLVACREGGREFVSVEELSAACPKVSQTHLEQLRNMGALGEMPDSSQMSLF